jgi:hypothetical protein
MVQEHRQRIMFSSHRHRHARGRLTDGKLLSSRGDLFRGQLSDPVRAVQFRVQAVDADDRDLRVAKPGPYPIE